MRDLALDSLNSNGIINVSVVLKLLLYLLSQVSTLLTLSVHDSSQGHFVKEEVIGQSVGDGLGMGAWRANDEHSCGSLLAQSVDEEV